MVEGKEKIWGIDTTLFDKHCVEVHLLQLKPGKSYGVCCSTHDHSIKQNLFYVLSGRVFVIVDGHVRILSHGEQIAITPHEVHQFLVNEEATVLEIVWAESITEDINRITSGKEMTKEEFEAAVLHAVAK